MLYLYVLYDWLNEVNLKIFHTFQKCNSQRHLPQTQVKP